MPRNDLLLGRYPLRSPGRYSVRLFLAALLYIGFLSVIFTSQFPAPQQFQLNVGDVSDRNILAPRRITYVSQVLTEAARERAEASVPEYYDPPDPRVAKEQVTYARQLFDFFETVRADSYSEVDEKLAMVRAVPNLSLTEELALELLELPDASWDVLREEVVSILDQAMREEIRENQLSLAKRRLPALISLDVPDEVIPLVVALTGDLVQPNTFVNAERTASERQAARNSVEPVMVTLERNESILRAGDIVQPQDLEALEALGLQYLGIQWPKVLVNIVFVTMSALLLGLYFARFHPRVLENVEYLGILLLYVVLFAVVAKIMVPDHTVLPYLFPAAAIGLIITALIHHEVAFVTSTVMALMVTYLRGGSIELGTYVLVGSYVGILSLRRIERLDELFWAGTYIGLVNVGVILLFRVPAQTTDLVGLATLAVVGVANGFLSASIALVSFFLIGNFTSLITPIQLIELARPTHPLLRHLLLKAPGTYHHSLVVSNLAEQAAERIGANALLTRVGTYYHDIGKSVRPYFFVENQTGDLNAHDKLDPRTSARIIISHVNDGLELARKYKVPPALQAFIREHQGTGIVKYFYHQALERAENPDEVDESDFRYPGPKPQSRETAILMLADSAEAAVRAAVPSSAEEIDRLVHKTMSDKLAEGELDECDLTFQDLRRIREAFVEILQGVFHPRVKYPDKLTTQKEVEAVPVAAQAGATTAGGDQGAGAPRPAS